MCCRAPSISPFEIYDASTASYGKKVSSTYQRYACGTFLPYFLYLHRLFQKAYGKTLFRSGTDAAGSKQKRVRTANSSLNSVHGSTLFNSLFQKAYGKSVQKRHGCCWFYAVTSLSCKLAAPKYTRMYILGEDVRGYKQ